ncbi:GerMN domain-containing protein [bacterium RCC_150]
MAESPGAPLGPGTAAPTGKGPAPAAGAAGPQPSPLPTTGAPAAPAVPGAPAVYFVAIGDAGNRGARFGCGDSLVGTRLPSSTGNDPLAAAMEELLSPGDAASRAGLYNALSGSALRYVSGYLDGSTAVVNLTGSLRPGGVCDNPRIEAQLTQTAVANTGASRAEIYVDGTPLAALLSLR